MTNKLNENIVSLKQEIAVADTKIDGDQKSANQVINLLSK